MPIKIRKSVVYFKATTIGYIMTFLSKYLAMAESGTYDINYCLGEILVTDRITLITITLLILE